MNRSETLVARIRAEFKARAACPEDLFLLTAGDASDFVRSGLAVGLALDGVEGFVQVPSGGFQPQQEFSNDAADFVGTTDAFASSTLQLIASGANNGVFFQVYFDTASEGES